MTHVIAAVDPSNGPFPVLALLLDPPSAPAAAGVRDAVDNEPVQVAPVGHPHERDRRPRRLRPGGQGSNYGRQGRRRQVVRCTFSTCHLNETLSVEIHDALLSAKGPEGHNNRSVVFLGKETAERGDVRKEGELGNHLKAC